VAWCFGYRNYLVHVLCNSHVLSLTCSHLNSSSTTTKYFSRTLHHSLYINIRRCWISSPFDKTSFTSKSASSREKTFSTNNHSSWHTVTKLFSQAINNTCHITLFYGGLRYFEWHKAHSNAHLCNFIPVWYIRMYLTFMEPCIAKCVFYITNEMQLIQCSVLLSALYKFWAGFPPIIRSL
jgi:hypothetical protein